MGINPFEHGSAKHTDIMKTEGLKQALNKYGFDAAFGGARRDEENPAPKSVFTHSATVSTAGIRRTSVRSCGTTTTARLTKGKHPRIPAVELDRAGHLAVHLPGKHRHRAAVSGEAASGAGA